ncbi:tRNA uridine-5-carboxymethylaminomethyl(34) synthesis GTPase MnmE [candidate division KSB1 bacterium]|nr:MAG: tRNA uridine-5-carboxymethylaminomethyl(34) synthesis GTPase MnmE [candidate division KSB1 bacterium]
MEIKESDTIAAISTPAGTSGIGVIRISGKNAFSIADRIFRGKVKPSLAKTFTAHFGYFIDPATGEKIDEVICLVMRAPKTYTCEDMVEISAHGGVLLLRYLLEKIFLCGARPAEPGEFTKRAFLNGRIDLTQAEAIYDLINARTKSGLKNAFFQLQGGINRKVRKIKEKLMENYSLLEAEIDFPEEGITYYKKDDMLKSLNTIKKKIIKIIDSFEEGKVIKEGIKIAICGKPNVGKSSLLNRLIQKDKAIVSEEPGTTRDLIEAEMMLGGILFQLVDTAGIRKAKNKIEKEGIRRTEKTIKESDFVILVIDYDDIKKGNLTELVKYISNNMRKISSRKSKESRIFIVLNKIDLMNDGDKKSIQDNSLVKISAKTGAGVNLLKKRFIEKIGSFENLYNGEVYLSNLRQKTLLEKSANSITQAEKDLIRNISEEYVAVSLKESIEFLNELTGESLKEEWLDIIFNKFCIGK